MSKPDFAGIVTGDWHLDRFNRLDDFARCVDFVIDKTIEKRRALQNPSHAGFYFIHTGDGYKTWHPAPIEMSVMHRVKRLEGEGINRAIIVGNHDWPESEDHAGVHCFMEMKTLGGVFQAVIDEPMIQTVQDAAGQVAGFHIYIPHIPKAKLQRSGLSYCDYFRRTLNELINQCQPGSRIILFTHAYVKEAAVGPSDLVIENERQITLADLKDERLLAVFLGDIHKAQKLCDKPLILYPGSLDRIDFGEAGEIKGITYYEVYGNEIKIEFIPTPARKFLHIVANLVTGDGEDNKFFDVPERASDIQPWLEEKFGDYDLKGSIVKVTIRCGPNHKEQIDDRKLSDLLVSLGADRVRSVNYDMVTPEQRRAPEITENLSPVAALGKWVDMQNYKPEIVGQSVLIAGKKLIGVEK